MDTSFVPSTTTSYGGIPTVANGVPAEYAQVNLTGQTAAIATTTLYTTPANGAGLYRATISEIITAVGTAGTIFTTISYNNGAANNAQAGGQLSTTALGDGGGVGDNTIVFYSAASQNITYATTLNGVTGTPAYSLRIRLEYLG